MKLFGKPIRVGKFGAEATEEDKTKLLSALRNLSSDMAAAIPTINEYRVDFGARGNPPLTMKNCWSIVINRSQSLCWVKL